MKKIKLILFFILYFCFSISVNIVHPITPSYVDSLMLPEYYFGFFFSLMSLGQVIGALFFGFLSDKIGRKWPIVIGIVGYCMAQACFGYINTMPWLILVFRVFSGIFVAAPNALFVSMSLDYSDNETKLKYLSILSSCNILGTAVGYEIGGSLYTYLNFTFQNVFLFQIIFGCCIALIFALFMKDKALNLNNKEKEENKSKFSFKNFKNLNGLVYLFLFGLLVLTIGEILINKYLDPYLTHIGFEPAILGHYVLITGIVGAIANLLIIPLIKKAKNKILAILLTSFIALSAILTFITFLVKTNILYLLFTTHMIYSILRALIKPLEQNEISTYSNGTNNGQLMGARQTILSIGNVLGPLLGSAIYVAGSPIIFEIAAFILLGSLLIYIIYFLIKYKRVKE